MSNPNEAKKLNTEQFRKSFARAMTSGIDIYFEQVRKNHRL